MARRHANAPHTIPRHYPPRRRLQGFLSKKSGDSWQRRWFELGGTTLRYFRDKGDTNVRG